MGFRVIIPVRYESTRLQGKALADIGGKPMVQRTYEQAIQSGADSVVIATDNDKIKEVAQGFGAQVCMTSPEHTSGTDRLAEAANVLGYEDDEVVVNVQGDEPLIPPVVIHQVANNLIKHESVPVATLCEKISSPKVLVSPANVKVVMNKRNFALYFSRAPIAWEKGNFPIDENGEMQGDHFRHIGIYAYRVGFLQKYLSWDPCPIEQMESLEQLRVLWQGSRIHVDIAKENIPLSVDTQEDLDQVRKLV